MGIEVVRALMLAAQRQQIANVTITVAEDVAEFLNNRKRRDLTRLEEDGRMAVEITGAKGVSPEHLTILCRDSEGREVKLQGL
jgi:ribonuclease E